MFGDALAPQDVGLHLHLALDVTFAGFGTHAERMVRLIGDVDVAARQREWNDLATGSTLPTPDGVPSLQDRVENAEGRSIIPDGLEAFPALAGPAQVMTTAIDGLCIVGDFGVAVFAGHGRPTSPD
jgi:hypothetical protein